MNFSELRNWINSIADDNFVELYGNRKAFVERVQDSGGVIIWGAGGGGRWALKVLKRYGVPVKRFVDQDSDKWGTTVEGIEVTSPRILDRGDFVVIGSIKYEQEIEGRLKSMGIPCIGGALFLFGIDVSVFMEEVEKIFEVYEMLEDEDSKKTFLSVIHYALCGDRSCLVVSDYKQYFHSKVLPRRGDVIVDGGAYVGDTVASFLEETAGECRIYAFEPDAGNFDVLEKRFSGVKQVVACKVGLWKENRELRFVSGMGESNRIDSGGDVPIEVVTLDSFLFGSNEKLGLIKLDVEGAEIEAVEGSKKIITRDAPRLQISLYHKTTHIFEIPLMLKHFVPEYRVFFGHHGCGWGDSVLYCTVEDSNVFCACT